MSERTFNWKNKDIRAQVDVVDSKLLPTLLLRNALVLNPYVKQWLKKNIWIYQDRIVYVGHELPNRAEEIHTIDCEGKYIVPGYIEPHAHPFQIYNPQTLAEYVSQYGTTTFVNDNLFLLLQSGKKKALTILNELKKQPVQYFWWSRYDLQTEVLNEDHVLPFDVRKQWIEHPDVIQGGEMTGWPRLVDGDDLMLHCMQATKKQRKRIEGHFPGASDKTLTKMKLFGADCDHEAMTGDEVMRRLELGYYVSLRNSSIRPDVRKILQELHEKGFRYYDHFFYTTDGATPNFYKGGMTNELIRIALEEGVPAIDAYNMASFNIAKYYQMDDYLGVVGPGRLASLNILEAPLNPNPVTVLSKGTILREDGCDLKAFTKTDWHKGGLVSLELSYDMTMDDLQFSMPMGVKMRNAVIMEPYMIEIDNSMEQLSFDHDESYLTMLDRHGKWRVNTMIKGFASSVQGFVSSFTTTGDIVAIGKNKADMLLAFARMKEIGGGIVLAENRNILHEIPLALCGCASSEAYEDVLEKEQKLRDLLTERGYEFCDPIYTLLFLQSTHLPYIRITPRGIFDVMKKTVLFPSIMR
ncbi:MULTISPECIES: adenine deaminase [Bacillus]|uniref:adenine deaminase n=1 Tax=Bacillus TaxID=1386 RepID=UPI0001CE3AFA|nr:MULTISPECIES: adenine deaminase [Bacillus]AMK71292.1 adenosine deaminase [Bacillus subtilis subsp. natto]API44953.1 adenosine deaminase [Bacillus subtilis]API95949.1 adenosine deaminase [Bacillus subtilis]ARI87341.1 adenosine deaminase [Bacillus subtilis]AVL05714.1 adenosine deaminase [Bacillus subtilis]